MELGTWLAFFAASWAISLSPGPGAVAAMSVGLNHGLARATFMTVGLVFGIWSQVLVVAVGLGALIAASSLAFAVVKWLGVAYLIWLGVRQWRAPAAPLAAEAGDAAAAPARRSLVLRGWLINALNPKGTAFMLAVMPQFLDLSAPLAPQYAVMALTDLVMSGYAALASRVLTMMRTARQARSLSRVFGSLFVAAGLLLATFKRA